MNYYHCWFNLTPGTKDTKFARAMNHYMTHLKEEGLIENWRLTRRKLGLGPKELGDFHIVMETKDLAQLDAAFALVASRREPTESAHFGVNSQVKDAVFALYRDFPDAMRHEGEEKF
ncbi:MAG: hypothetical protein KGJ79_08070 [Alphaproteobacteria bacterium]|nr:hypothetical protein [Alphaproteobacteria bacterium]MDE2111084.1 hypothetical protein [Alphaproteobacteria bacterium]MDE2494784.1 hypothetical protein [Alphaproteobacteria bacterium]